MADVTLLIREARRLITAFMVAGLCAYLSSVHADDREWDALVEAYYDAAADYDGSPSDSKYDALKDAFFDFAAYYDELPYDEKKAQKFKELQDALQTYEETRTSNVPDHWQEMFDRPTERSVEDAYERIVEENTRQAQLEARAEEARRRAEEERARQRAAEEAAAALVARDAQLNAGLEAYRNGEYHKAFELLSTQLSRCKAYAPLISMHVTGRGTIRDLRAAASLAVQGYRAGDLDSKELLDKIRADAFRVVDQGDRARDRGNDQEAIAFYEDARPVIAELGGNVVPPDFESAMELADMALNGKSPGINNAYIQCADCAVNIWGEAAEYGYPKAQALYGRALVEGIVKDEAGYVWRIETRHRENQNAAMDVTGYGWILNAAAFGDKDALQMESKLRELARNDRLAAEKLEEAEEYAVRRQKRLARQQREVRENSLVPSSRRCW